jgi:hypothetical protein
VIPLQFNRFPSQLQSQPIPPTTFTPVQQLRRAVLSCLLWEDQFYQDGESIAAAIERLAALVTVEELIAVIHEARHEQHLRHVSLWLLLALVKQHRGKAVGDAIYDTLVRADEPAELLALYWRNGKVPLSKQLKRGLALSLTRFSPYALAKYNRDNPVKLRDVLFMTHAKPQDEAQAAVWKDLAENTLAAPDTWEVALSAGADKKATWERLLAEEKLGYLALLRNLRGMMTAGVDADWVKQAILARKGAEKILPFRFVAAARACPQMEPTLDEALSEAISALPILPGRTIVLVDVSGSMDWALSKKSDLRRIDAAATLASLINGNVRVFSFSERVIEVPPRRGMAGVDAIIKSQPHSGTELAKAVRQINQLPHDRLIVITDEQVTDGLMLEPVAPHAYLINVASYQNGIDYGAWRRINGFSENVLRWLTEMEQSQTERA